PSDGVLSLREAIADAGRGDTIKFADSLQGKTLALSGTQLAIYKSLNIEGPGAGQLTISGYGTRVFLVSSESEAVQVSISGLTLRDGQGVSSRGVGLWYPSEGGAVLNEGIGAGATLTISNCTLSNNFSDTGGAISNRYGTLFVNNCVFSDN